MGLRYDAIKDDELSHVAERDILLNYLALGNVFQTNGHAYVSSTIELNPQFQMNAIVRYDLFNFAMIMRWIAVICIQQLLDGILTYKLNFDYALNQNTLVCYMQARFSQA
ncbi:MAG: hypothetical protein IPI65_14440 [Bacteroidetes bacterium]|nr:hypothetical protein [Bacteroidota bacterium]